MNEGSPKCGHGTFLLPETREDKSKWTDDPRKKKPLKIDINGIRLGKLIVVKREVWQEKQELIAEFLVKISDLYYKDSKLLFMETRQEYMEKLK